MSNTKFDFKRTQTHSKAQQESLDIDSIFLDEFDNGIVHFSKDIFQIQIEKTIHLLLGPMKIIIIIIKSTIFIEIK